MAQSPPRIHRAVPSDVDSIMDVHIAGRSAYYRGFLPDEEIAADNALVRGNRDGYLGRIADPAFTVLCAEVDRRVVGFALAGPCHAPDPAAGTTTELRLMFVDPGYFRRGIGGALNDALVASWQAAGVGSARLWVWEFNTAARALYAARDWRADGWERPDSPRIGEHRMLGYLLTVSGSPETASRAGTGC